MIDEHTVGFAGNSVKLDCGTPRITKIVDFLFQFIPPTDAVPPRVNYTLSEDDGGEMLVNRGEESIYSGKQDGELAEQLMGDVCHELILDCSGGMMYHAAALAWKGRGVLIPGGIGAGKSTLTTWLVSRGFDYLTDELVYFPQSSSVIHAFPRPLHLKKPSRAVLNDLIDYENLSDGVMVSSYSDMVIPTVIKPDNLFSNPPLELILFPRFTRDAEFSFSQLSRAHAGLALMQCLINARNLPDHGFSEAVRLARLVPAYSMVYGSFDQLAGRIETLLV